MEYINSIAVQMSTGEIEHPELPEEEEFRKELEDEMEAERQAEEEEYYQHKDDDKI